MTNLKIHEWCFPITLSNYVWMNENGSLQGLSGIYSGGIYEVGTSRQMSMEVKYVKDEIYEGGT